MLKLVESNTTTAIRARAKHNTRRRRKCEKTQTRAVGRTGWSGPVQRAECGRWERRTGTAERRDGRERRYADCGRRAGVGFFFFRNARPTRSRRRDGGAAGTGIIISPPGKRRARPRRGAVGGCCLLRAPESTKRNVIIVFASCYVVCHTTSSSNRFSFVRHTSARRFGPIAPVCSAGGRKRFRTEDEISTPRVVRVVYDVITAFNIHVLLYLWIKRQTFFWTVGRDDL